MLSFSDLLKMFLFSIKTQLFVLNPSFVVLLLTTAENGTLSGYLIGRIIVAQKITHDWNVITWIR